VHAPLRDRFAVEVDELPEEPHVLKQLRTARTGSHDVLVVHDRATAGGRQLVRHEGLLEVANASSSLSRKF
jgi:hypothetical protein